MKQIPLIINVEAQTEQEELWEVSKAIGVLKKAGMSDEVLDAMFRTKYEPWFLELSKALRNKPVIALKAMCEGWNPDEIADALGVPRFQW